MQKHDTASGAGSVHPVGSPEHERAVLAGGCFWGMQELIRRYEGVVSTRVGYTGGEVQNATYRNHGRHAEAIEITFAHFVRPGWQLPARAK